MSAIRYTRITWTCDHCGTKNVTDFRYGYRMYLYERCNGIGCPVRLGWNRTSDSMRLMHVPNISEKERLARAAARKAMQAEERAAKKAIRALEREKSRMNRYITKVYGLEFACSK